MMKSAKRVTISLGLLLILVIAVNAQSGWDVSGNPITTSESVLIDGDLTVYKKKIEFVDKNNGIADGMGIKFLNLSDMGLYADQFIQFLESDVNQVKFHFDLNQGKFGIGTTSPSGLIHIHHPTKTIGTPANFNDSYLLFSNAASQYMGIDPNQIYTSHELNLQTAGNHPIDFSTNNILRMRISGTGFVGIGTDNPLSKLDLNGGNSDDVVLRIEADTDNIGSEADNPRIEMYQDGGGSGALIGFNYDWGGAWEPDNLFRIGTRYSNVNYYNRLVIRTDNGYVGIGTDNPTEQLSVNGTIRSKEIKVEATPWPDYVFAEDYSLKSLEETETFIKENKRLPDMPSAQEVAENGIMLGEMNRLLLEKVEELTLYVIELKKENILIKEENKRQNETLEKLVTTTK